MHNFTRYLYRSAALALLSLSAGLPVSASVTAPSITLKPSASVSTEYFTLADIASIHCNTHAQAVRLAAVQIGRCPLSGAVRTIGRGDVFLKLRQAHFDPAQLSIRGASSVVLTASDTAASTTAVSPAGSQTVKEEAPGVKSGEDVDICVVDGPVTLKARGYATSSGHVGALVSVRREGSPHALRGRVIAEGQVQLEN